MKQLTTAAWIGWALWTMIVVYHLSVRHPGGDAPGRAGGTLIALLSVPVLLIAAALLLWNWRGGPALAGAIGSTLILAPICLAVLLTIRVNAPNFLRLQRSAEGRFSDPKLRELARAIDDNDAAAIRRLAADPSIDRRQRDPEGRTILGHAIARASEPRAGTAVQLEAVEQLIRAHGGTWDDTALDPNGQSLARINSTGGDPATALIDLAFRHGADVNGPASSGLYPLIFDPAMDLPRLQLFARYGADVHAVAPKSAGGIEGWTLLMCAADRGRFAMATWLLEQGVDFRHVAPNELSLKTLLGSSSLFHSEAPAPSDPDERRFFDALRPKMGPP